MPKNRGFQEGQSAGHDKNQIIPLLLRLKTL
jgi:hypothetical protein